jgi:hypothetical protein
VRKDHVPLGLQRDPAAIAAAVLVVVAVVCRLGGRPARKSGGGGLGSRCDCLGLRAQRESAFGFYPQ